MSSGRPDSYHPLLALECSTSAVSSGAFNLDSDLEAGKAVLAEDESSLRRSNGKVREQLRSADEDSYKPQNVPIGPYHRNCSSSWIEKEKLRYVGFMQCRSQKCNNGGGLNGLVEDLEPEARKWYGDGVDHMTPEEFARMLLHDGCYLIAWLRSYPDAPQTCNNHNMVFRDTLYLLENQVPFILLEGINGRAKSSGLLPYMARYIQSLLHAQLYISPEKPRLPEHPSHLLHLVHTYFHPTPTNGNGNGNGEIADPPKRRCQLLHRVRTYFSPPPSADPQHDMGRTHPYTGRWRRATEYCMHANVQFRCRDFAANVTCILDVRLQGGTLDIPCLHVGSGTWTLLRNLMALEEQMPKRPVTAYCIFMSQVACTVEDVRLLVEAKIIQHWQGSDKIAAQGFANLCNGVAMDVHDKNKNYLKPIWHNLEKLCDSKARNFKGSFRQKYCSTTLQQVVFGVTAFLALCQLLQSIYAPIAYHFPKH
ncbi:hypothetical protein ZWY2020_055208 [Hordeum vulgare]|nr:hypothetical protein ZWY2020_055208 [Hordeum vulgare]